MPSATTTRSAPWARISASIACGSASCSNWSSTPTARHRCCKIANSAFRPMPLKPWPPERSARDMKWTSMSSQ